MKRILFHSLFYVNFICCCFATNINSINQDSTRYYYSLANHPKSPSDLQKALGFYLNLKENSKSKKDTISLIRNLRQIAIIQLKMGFNFDSESSAIEALKILDKYESDEIESRIGIYNHLGRVYRTLKDYNIALSYYQKAEKLTKDIKKLNIIQNNIAYLYQSQKKYELAEKKYKDIYSVSLKTNDSIQIARALANLGYVKSKLNKEDALKLMQKALSIRIDLMDSEGIYSSYNYLSKHYKSIDNNQKAKEYAIKALSIAEKLRSASYLENALANLIELDNNPNVKRYKRLADSLSNAKQISENKYALFKYNYFKNEKLAKENEVKKEKEKRLKQLYQAIGILLLLTGIFSYLIIISKHKREKLQEVLNTESEISKRIHDEVANDIYVVMNKVQNNVNQEEVLDKLDAIYIKTRNISNELNADYIEKNFDFSLNDLLLQFSSNEISVLTKGVSKIDWKAIPPITKNVIYKVLQELMVNMKKHSKASSVLVSFEQKTNDVIINYKDNGIGCSIKKKNGLTNMENRIKSIGGRIIFDSQKGKGFKAYITI